MYTFNQDIFRDRGVGGFTLYYSFVFRWIYNLLVLYRIDLNGSERWEKKHSLTHTQDNTPQLFARLLIDFVEWIGVHVICFCFCTALHWFSFFWPFVYFAFDAGNLCLNCPCDCLLCVNAEFAFSSFCIPLTQSSEKKTR